MWQLSRLCATGSPAGKASQWARLWARMRSLRLNIIFWSGLVACWLLLNNVVADPKDGRHERHLQALKTADIPKTLQADMPAEVVPKLIGEVDSGEDDAAAAVKPKKRESSLVRAGGAKKLKVCILTADFWGLKSAGGTATAYHLLAAVLAKEENLDEAKELNTRAGLKFECLGQHHFEPEVAEASPYEATSHAALEWMIEDAGRCDIVHAHEWGGVFADIVTMNHFRQLQLGLRVAIEPHGGHVWSQLGEMNRPMDVGALRIDNHERMTNALNDMEISPTNYMLSYLRQRGWVLPNATMVIPNVVPDAEKHEISTTKQKKVWRIAFFSRLEERKGIKLFVEALSKLQATTKISDNPEFEIYIVGPEAVIDMVPSKKWLTAQTADWKVKTHLKIGIKREEALDIISMDGILLVLCSYIDNMPYVVAEAAVKAIPFLTFDAGGVLELFDHERFGEVVVKDSTAEALAEKLGSVLDAGKITTVQLTRNITRGQQKWLAFHDQFAGSTEQNRQEDEALLKEAKAKAGDIKVVPIKEDHSALELWEPICLKGDATSDQALLFLPEEYELLEPTTSGMEIAELLKIAELRHSPVGALTFGAELPIGKVAYPSAPTWIAYAGDHQRCLDQIPVAVSTATFCGAFLGQARVFRYYNAWVLAMLLEHSGRVLHTYPKVYFKASEFTTAGSSNCAADKIPRKRGHDYSTAASRLFRSADAMMHSMVLAQTQKPLVSLLDDATPAQRHKGWEFGFLDGFANQTRKIHHLVWENPEDNEFKEQLWGCGKLPDKSFIDYPHFKHQLLHPCHHGGAKCCNGTVHAPFMLRLTSFFHADQAALVLAYDAYPVCGDGFDFMVTHYPADLSAKPEIIVNAGYDTVLKTSRPQRQKLEVPINIRPGDQLDFVVDPRNNHDCDGLYIVEAKIWPPIENERTKKKRLLA